MTDAPTILSPFETLRLSHPELATGPRPLKTALGVEVPVVAGIYTRISLDATGQGLGVERQKEDGLEIAKRKGWPVYRVYTDNSKSAFRRGVKRPAFEQMVKDISAGVINCVIVWKVDRMVRQPRDLERLIDLADFRDLLVATWDSTADLSTREGRLRLRIEATVAADASHAASDRIKRVHNDLRAKGKSIGGKPPYGYNKDWSIDTDRAVVMQEVAGRLLGGESSRAVAMDLNDRGIRTTRKLLWDGSNLGRTLKNPAYAGLLRYGNDISGNGHWTPLWSVETYLRLTEMFANPSRNTGRGARKYLLRGTVVCGTCKEKMVGHPQGQRSHYVCTREPRRPNACGKCARSIAPVDEFVRDWMIEGMLRHQEAMQSTSATTLLPSDGTDEIMEKITRLRAKLADIDARYDDDEIDGDQHARLSSSTRTKIKELEPLARTAATAGPTILDDVMGKDPAEVWAAWSFEQQREAIEVLIERVEILPQGKGYRRSGVGIKYPQFDPSTIKVIPR